MGKGKVGSDSKYNNEKQHAALLFLVGFNGKMFDYR
jgi:hypothetical protein